MRQFKPVIRCMVVALVSSWLAACSDEPSQEPGDMDVGPEGDTPPEDAGDTAWPDLPAVPDPGPWEPGGWVYGWSELGRPLVVEHFGDHGPVLFLLGGMHGDEVLGYTIQERLRSTLLGGAAERAGIRVVFVQASNPDGYARGKRYNANDVDLNRNWPTDNYAGRAADGGDYPLSEPESAALRAVVDLSDLSGILSYHCCLFMLDHDGPDSQPLAETMAAAMETEGRFPVGRLGYYAGSLGSYAGLELERPIITVEFTVDEAMNRFVQLESVALATDAAMAWILAEGEDPTTAGGAVVEAEDSPLDSFVLADSAGGLEVRLEDVRVGTGDPVLVLSGLVDNDRHARWVAEHVRRELLANLANVPLLFVTAANPDGVASDSPSNGEGVVVAEDLFSGDLESAEADALATLFDTDAPALVVHVAAGATDGVAVRGISAEAWADQVSPQLTMLGEAEGALADWLAERGIGLLELTVAREYGRGDTSHDDFNAEGDPTVYSAVVRRAIKPSEDICAADGDCTAGCTDDPDCPCACDYTNDVCEAAERGSTAPCHCDADCAGGVEPCHLDGSCDRWCPVDEDPDC